MPDRPHHTQEMHDCVEKLQEKGFEEPNAWAICTATMQKAGKPIFEGADGKPITLESAMQLFDLPTSVRRDVHLVGAVGTIRTASFHGREHLVVPVTALCEGVIFPVNAETPELVLAEEFCRVPQGWNGRPVFLGHPMRNGVQVSGNDPEVLENGSFGTVFNTKIVNNQLRMEAWVDPQRAEKVGSEAVRTLERMKNGDIVEVSVGVFVTAEQKTGKYKDGKPYAAVWHDIVPDHLAILPEGHVGACDIAMGCGTHRSAMVHHLITAEGIRPMEVDEIPVTDTERAQVDEYLRAARDISQKEREKIPESDFAGKGTSFPIRKPGDVWAAARSIGRAGADNYDTDTLKRNIISIAYRKGSAFVAQLPEEWKKKFDQKAAEENPLTAFIQQAKAYIEGIRAAVGRRNSAEDQRLIQNLHDSSVNLGAECTPVTTAEHHAQQSKETDMVKCDRIKALMANPHNPMKDEKALEAASDETLTALEAHCTALKAAEEKAATDKKAAQEKAAAEVKTAEEKAAAEKKALEDQLAATKKEADDLKAAAAKQKTEEEFLATAPPSIRTLVERQKALEAARKDELVAKLKTAQSVYTEDQLKAMPLDQLETTAKLVKVGTPAVDYSAQGAPRAAAGQEEGAPPPIDLHERIRTARGIKSA